jgi:hypothetical protein
MSKLEITSGNGVGKIRLLDRSHLDGRTHSAKVFTQLAAAIESDLGGRDELSAIELQLIEAFCGASVMLNHLNAKLVQSESVDPLEYAQAASTLVRIANRLGLRRRAKDISPSLADILNEPDEAHG